MGREFQRYLSEFSKLVSCLKCILYAYSRRRKGRDRD